MPIYEYRCSECGFQEEHLQKVSEAPLTTCPSCGKPTFKKMLSAAGFQLKGSGWYATDFKGSGKPAPAKTEAKGDATTEAKSGASSDKAEPKSGEKTESAKAEPVAASPAASTKD